MVDILLWILGPVLLLLIASRALNAYKELNDQPTSEDDERNAIRDQIRKRTVYIDVFLENISDQWYGWTVSTTGQEYFVSQGATWDEAKQNCTDRLMEKNNGVIYVIKFIKR